MDADERLTALKKAYADIILNTAKEAAARIMVSEKKAMRLEHELYAAKGDALQMLLRLKRMMDCKISEAEMTSFSQHRKIEELEAQLHEAEDIVNDLREELREVQAELEKVPNKGVKNLEQDNVSPLETPGENTLNISQSIGSPQELRHEFAPPSNMGNLNLNQTIESHKYHPLVPMGNSYIGSPDLPSIILSSKEPELYRNGCTQRIRACERTPLDKELSFSEKTNDAKHESTMKDNREGERICRVPPSYEVDKKEEVQDDSRVGSWYQVRVVTSFGRKRKRATRYRKNRPPCLYQPVQFKKTYQTPGISRLTNPNSVKDCTQSKEDPSLMAPTVSSDTNDMGTEQGCTETIKTDAAFVREELVSMREEKSECLQSSKVPACQMKIEKIDVPLVNTESKASDTASDLPIQPGNDRIIKYTFQRRRKRDTLSSSDGNASTANSTLKRKERDSENGYLEPDKSSLIEESSRDSRRLAQVARQLISLSEKKWWQ